jgi:hypothetical protein
VALPKPKCLLDDIGADSAAEAPSAKADQRNPRVLYLDERGHCCRGHLSKTYYAMVSVRSAWGSTSASLQVLISEAITELFRFVP